MTTSTVTARRKGDPLHMLREELAQHKNPETHPQASCGRYVIRDGPRYANQSIRGDCYKDESKHGEAILFKHL